jgi:hypothetical protein
MTGAQLLVEAKKHFSVLYGDTVGAFDHLVTQALGTFQDKAGYLGQVQTPEGESRVAVPPGFLALVSAKDAAGQFHEVTVSNETIMVVETVQSVRPYTISFFVDLRAYNLTIDAIPPDIIGILLEYLIALIDIPNTARARRVALATGQQVEIRSDQELLERKQALEMEMEEEYAILPMITVG